MTKSKNKTTREKKGSREIAWRANPPDTLLRAVQQFAEYHHASRVSRNLRNLFLEFLLSDGAEAIYFKELVTDLEGLFDLLEAIQKEQTNRELLSPEQLS